MSEENFQEQNNNSNKAESMMRQIQQSVEKKRLDKLRQEITPLVESHASLARSLTVKKKAYEADVRKTEKEMSDASDKIQILLVDEGLTEQQLKQVLGS